MVNVNVCSSFTSELALKNYSLNYYVFPKLSSGEKLLNILQLIHESSKTMLKNILLKLSAQTSFIRDIH